jgi:hypothetical protein
MFYSTVIPLKIIFPVVIVFGGANLKINYTTDTSMTFE